MININVQKQKEGLSWMMKQDDVRQVLLFYHSKILFNHDKCISEIMAGS